jgi:hypothetical protein
MYFAATCFGLRWPSSGGIHNIFGKLPHNGSVVICCCLFIYLSEFEAFTVVSMKSAVCWDVAPCEFIINPRFGGKYRLHLQKKLFLVVFGRK